MYFLGYIYYWLGHQAVQQRLDIMAMASQPIFGAEKIKKTWQEREEQEQEEGMFL